MILLDYIILAHPDWHKSHLKIFSICAPGKNEQTREELEELIASGRLPITLTNIEIITSEGNQNVPEIIRTHSTNAALTIMSYRDKNIKEKSEECFCSYND